VGKQALEKKLDTLDALRLDPASSEEPLRKALKDRNGFFVSKAAAVAGKSGIHSLAPDLAAAFDRFLINPAKSDPQCWVKIAIAKALKDLNFDDPSLFLRGLAHIQMEGVWGGSVDTAAPLRSVCALALIACPLPRAEILQPLVDLLAADAVKTVRIDAARALAQLAGPDTLLLLRLKALAGDAEPEVVGQCLLGLLDLAPVEYVPFVARLLEKGAPDIRLEAAVALGECAREDAVEALTQTFHKFEDRELRRAIAVSLGSSRLESAAAFLLSVVQDSRADDAANAIRALRAGRFREEYRDRITKAIRDRGDLDHFLTETV
jgi:HEAT repeat protein